MQMKYVIGARKTESGIRYVPMSEEVVACFRRIFAIGQHRKQNRW